MARYYLDTAPIVYSVERIAPYVQAVDAKLAASGLVLVASELSRLECRVKPVRKGDAALLQEFDDFFAGNVAEIVMLSRGVIDLATEVRAQFGFKTPDAIHLAAAVFAGCDVFLTNDHRLSRFTNIVIETL